MYQVDRNAVGKLKSDLGKDKIVKVSLITQNSFFSEIYIPSFSVIESFQIFQQIKSKL